MVKGQKVLLPIKPALIKRKPPGGLLKLLIEIEIKTTEVIIWPE